MCHIFAQHAAIRARGAPCPIADPLAGPADLASGARLIGSVGGRLTKPSVAVQIWAGSVERAALPAGEELALLVLRVN